MLILLRYLIDALNRLNRLNRETFFFLTIVINAKTSIVDCLKDPWRFPLVINCFIYYGFMALNQQSLYAMINKYITSNLLEGFCCIKSQSSIITFCIGVSGRSVLVNGRVRVSKAKTQSKILLIVFLRRVTSVRLRCQVCQTCILRRFGVVS